MGKDTFKYIGICMGIYLSLAAVGLLLLNIVSDLFPSGVYTPLILQLIYLLIIDPLLTRYLSDRLGFKELNNGDYLE